MLRKIAFGYSTQCNLRCAHCVASQEISDNRKMDLHKAKQIIVELGQAGVGGHQFFPQANRFCFFKEIAALVQLCHRIGIYSRIVTNSFLG